MKNFNKSNVNTQESIVCYQLLEHKKRINLVYSEISQLIVEFVKKTTTVTKEIKNNSNEGTQATSGTWKNKIKSSVNQTTIDDSSMFEKENSVVNSQLDKTVTDDMKSINSRCSIASNNFSENPPKSNFEKELIKMTNDELKYLNGLASEMNQLSNRISSSVNNTSTTINIIETNAIDENVRAHETLEQVRIYTQNNQTSLSKLWKMLVCFVLMTVFFYMVLVTS